MKISLLLCCTTIVLAATTARADSIAIGTPGDSLLSTPTGPSPKLGTLINFDSLVAFASAPSFTVGGATFSSPDGLEVLPFSSQSFPMELFDMSSDGTANITIKLPVGVGAIGVGIADSDPVFVTFQALNALGVPFGSIFTEDLSATESTINTGNGYYVISDTFADIYGLQIKQLAGDPASFSGLAIDDVATTAPEPGTLVLGLTGLAAMLKARKLRRSGKNTSL
jgi:hypothetical protein